MGCVATRTLKGWSIFHEQLRGGRPLAQDVDHCTLCTLAGPSKRLELNCTTRKFEDMGQMPTISQLLIHFCGGNTFIRTLPEFFFI